MFLASRAKKKDYFWKKIILGLWPLNFWKSLVKQLFGISDSLLRRVIWQSHGYFAIKTFSHDILAQSKGTSAVWVLSALVHALSSKSVTQYVNLAHRSAGAEGI